MFLTFAINTFNPGRLVFFFFYFSNEVNSNYACKFKGKYRKFKGSFKNQRIFFLIFKIASRFNKNK